MHYAVGSKEKRLPPLLKKLKFSRRKNKSAVITDGDQVLRKWRTIFASAADFFRESEVDVTREGDTLAITFTYRCPPIIRW